MLPYFAYGSNLNRADMRLRCPGARPVTPATLVGWRLTFRGVADIEPDRGRSVLGGLWTCSREDVCSLDRYEGAPSNYRQLTVEVETPDGPREAMTYVMCDDGYLGLPSEWYYGRIEAGYRDWDLPLSGLREALEETGKRLAGLGIGRYAPTDVIV